MVLDDLKHGGALDVIQTQFPNAPQPWIDLSTGINPWAYPRTEIAQGAMAHLPTRAENDACRSAMAHAFGAPPGELLLSPGSELLIRLLPDLLPAKRIAILTPTYGDHTTAWSRTGAEMISTRDPLAHTDRADIVIVCQPNNPDGRTFRPADLMAAADQLAARGGWLIVDEAYADLDPSLSIAPHAGRGGLIVLRSFGKFYGLAGLRLGAVIAPHGVRQLLAERLGIWPISATALAIGTRAYRDVEWQAQMRAQLAKAAANLDDGLSTVGVKVVGGTSLFRYLDIDNAHAVWQHLAEHGLYVRRFAQSPKHLRVGLPANDAEAERLQRAFSLLT
ncbi:MAG: threonine-phosphate decarboxylase CobD [Pseudomonadota bacterium]